MCDRPSAPVYNRVIPMRRPPLPEWSCSSADGAGSAQRRDLFGVVAERLQDFVRVLTDAGGWPLDRRTVVLECERGERDGDLLADARHRVVPVQHAAAFEVPIGERLAQLAHAGGRDVTCLEERL